MKKGMGVVLKGFLGLMMVFIMLMLSPIVFPLFFYFTNVMGLFGKFVLAVAMYGVVFGIMATIAYPFYLVIRKVLGISIVKRLISLGVGKIKSLKLLGGL